MSANQTVPDPSPFALAGEQDNSVADQTQDAETRVSTRAHQIWEAEGRPHGRETAHWDQAQREIAQEDERGADPSQKAEIEHADAFKIAFGRG